MKREDKRLLETARKRLKLCQDAERKNRHLAREDFRFYAGEQWPEDIRRRRNEQGPQAVCLTVNRCKPAVKQIANDQRQNRGAIRVSPVDSGADPDTAKVLQGIIRHIEYNSDADIAYDTAMEHVVIGGCGYIRVLTEFEDDTSWQQCIKIARVRNPFTVYLDPSSTSPDGSDAKYAFIVTKMTHDEYETEYPHSEMASLSDAEDAEEKFPDWVDEGGIILAEYYYIETETDTLYLLRDGRTVQASVVTPEEDDIVNRREITREKVKWCKMNAAEVLERTDWEGRHLPVVRVIGDELEVDGDVYFEGVIRQAKDSQRMVNYWESKKTEAIALAPKAPFIAAAGQIANYRHEWSLANSDNFAVLTYDPVTVDGTLVPQPQRNTTEPPIAAITAAGISAIENFKATTQLFEASYGQPSNEKSGRAILARQQQGQVGNFHFVDNLTRSRRHLGRILLDLIPKIYNEPGRILRIIGEDDSEGRVQIGAVSKVWNMERVFDIGVGRYDVIVESGPNFATKRKEATESMLGVLSTVPAIFPVIGDLLIKNMDWPGAMEIAERLRPSTDKEQTVPPAVQQKLEQMGTVLELLTKELNAKNTLIETKQQELDSRERIEMAKLAVRREEITAQVMQNNAQLDTQEQIALLRAEVEGLKLNRAVDSASLAGETERASEVQG
jgi:hypothetical protein